MEARAYRFAELRRRGGGLQLAAQTAGSAHGPWRLANSPALTIALPNAYFDSLGLPRLVASIRLTRRTAGCGPACPVVWQGRAGNRAPYADSYSFTGGRRRAMPHAITAAASAAAPR